MRPEDEIKQELSSYFSSITGILFTKDFKIYLPILCYSLCSTVESRYISNLLGISNFDFEILEFRDFQVKSKVIFYPR